MATPERLDDGRPAGVLVGVRDHGQRFLFYMLLKLSGDGGTTQREAIEEGVIGALAHVASLRAEGHLIEVLEPDGDDAGRRRFVLVKDAWT